MLWYGDPSNRVTELHGTLVDFNSPVDLVAVCSSEYLPAWDWGTHQQICRKLRMTVGLNWAWCRNQPRSSLCATCGWLTQRVYLDEDQCYECHNVGVCRECAYLAPNNKRRCVQCDFLPGVQTITSQQRNMSAFLDSVGDKYDASYCLGEYYRPDIDRTTDVLHLGAGDPMAVAMTGHVDV